MRRLAILLANTNGLYGTKKDIVNFSNFLQSDVGGAWNGNEICIENDVSKNKLLNFIQKEKAEQNFDYIIFYFSGHGGYERNTVIELNKNNETIDEREIRNLAKRQLNIFDCCRSYPDVKQESVLEKSYESINFSTSIREIIRKQFDARIMQAREQQMSLYACSEGETAEDTGEGGVYTINFLNAAKEFSRKEQLVIEAHIRATEIIRNEGFEQTPDYLMARLKPEEQLIISINSECKIFG